MIRRAMAGLYATGLLLLPGWLRREAGPEMQQVFVSGQETARRDGPLTLVAFWLREFRGLLQVAYRSRFPDPWTRRTKPPAGSPSNHPATTDWTMEHLGSDIRFAFRTFLRRPAMTVLSMLTLSLGIGASTAMFSVVQSVILKPLPYPEADRLVSVYPGWPSMRGHPTLGRLADRGTWSWPEFFGVAENQTVFESLAAYEGTSVTLTGDGPAQRVSGVRTTWQLFPMLGAAPEAGRLFNSEDERASRVVILSHGSWRDRYGSDPTAVGRTVILNEEAYEIVGVLPAGFDVFGTRNAELWFPMTGSFTTEGLGNHGGTRAIARLADGVTVEQARGAITGIFQSILDAGHGEHVAAVFPRHDDETREARPVLVVMLAASVLLLIVACGNAAAFLLGVGIDRERELAVRGALGAARRRMVSQLLTESGLLAGVSVLGGVVAAVGLSRLMLMLAPTGVPGLEGASIDGVVLLFSTLTAVGFGLVFGLIPALSLSSVDIAGAMGSSRSTRSRRARLQSAVVVGELALASILAVSGLLLMRTVGALNDVDPGFDVDELVAVAFAIPSQRFRTEDGETDNVAVQVYLSGIREEIRALPGVKSVAVTSVPPFSNWRGNNDVSPENWDPSRPPPIAERRFVSPNFFETTGIEIVEGRGFSADEALDEEDYVVVISEGLADLGWPDESPIGRPLRYWGREATVVGVARNVRDERIEDVTELAFYAPGSSGPLVIRTEGDPTALLPSIRERIWAVDEDLPILLSSSLTGLISDSIAEARYRARLMGVFAVLAGLLALLGIYGVTSRAVARRSREIGIRVAMGAKRVRVWSMVAVQAFRLALGGALVGVLGSFAASRFLESFLWGVEPGDPRVLLMVVSGLPLLAIVAAVQPARRATRVDPLEVLRDE